MQPYCCQRRNHLRQPNCHHTTPSNQGRRKKLRWCPNQSRIVSQQAITRMTRGRRGYVDELYKIDPLQGLLLIVCPCILFLCRSATWLVFPFPGSGFSWYLFISLSLKNNRSGSINWCNRGSEYWGAWDPDDTENLSFCRSSQHEYPFCAM